MNIIKTTLCLNFERILTLPFRFQPGSSDYETYLKKKIFCDIIEECWLIGHVIKWFALFVLINCQIYI